MKKKIIFGSIFAVTILIFLSFTPVIGFQNAKTNPDSATSPLFSIRNKRAINEKQNYETCSYLGKGKEIEITLPKRNNEKALIQDLIAKINEMDDKSFNKLVINFITRLNQDDNSHNYNARKIILSLNLLRNLPNKMVQDNIYNDKNNYFKAKLTSDCTVDGNSFPGCYLYYYIMLFVWIALMLKGIISIYLPNCPW